VCACACVCVRVCCYAGEAGSGPFGVEREKHPASSGSFSALHKNTHSPKRSEILHEEKVGEE
jgi:hypothetical protein